MKLSLFSIAAILLASAEAAVVQFNVVAPGSDTVQVSIDGQLTSLQTPNPMVPFWTGAVEVGSATKYSYISNDKKEEFGRDIPAERTFNDFFNRPVTVANIPALPRPLDDGREWNRSDKNPSIFDMNYIPSIFVNGDVKKINKLVEKAQDKKLTVDLTMIGKDYVKTFNNVTLSISGAGKSKNPAKQQWRWTLSPGDLLDNRFNFKIRHMEEDPTQLREKLYADVLRAMGVASNEANFVRYYMNGEGFGTYNLLDDVKSYSYIAAQFYGGNPPAQMGPLYDGASGASFAVQQDEFSYGSFKPTKGSPEGSEAIHQLAVAFSQLDVKDNYAINRFEDIFDIDQFLRYMVMEYLGGHWDGYWEMQTNDGAYKDYANNNTWHYLGQDYDGTFGINMPVDSLQFSYKNLVANHPEAVLINGFLQNADLAKRFESYIVDTVKTLFNNNTLGPHVMAYYDFIKEDIKWDRSIKQLSPGWTYAWTPENGYDNLFKWVEAPNKNSGAQYGLTEWISKKAQVVANEFKFSL